MLEDGSHTFETYLDFIFTGSGYSYRNEVKRYAFEKQSFGLKSRLSLFNDIVKQANVEFVIHGRVVRILNQSGSDLTTVVRKNFNMNELQIEKDIQEFSTYQEGFGAWNDDQDHSKGRLRVSYTSPLAQEYGVIEAEPFVDERYADSESLLAKLKANIDSSFSLSIQIDMEDLTHSGYPYTQPRCGDYIMAINDVLGFRRRVRIIAFTSSYDIRGRLIGHKITCGSISAVKKSVNQVSALSAKIGQAQIETAEAYKTALEAMIAVNGKNKNYWGATFPKDSPPGTLIKGDQLYYQNGEKTELYVWNGLEWERAKLGISEEEFDEKFNLLTNQINIQDSQIKEQVSDILAKAEANEDLATEAKKLGEQARTEARNAQVVALNKASEMLEEAKRLDNQNHIATERAISDAITKANREATRLVSLSEQALNQSITDLSTDLKKTNERISLKADKTVVDGLSGKVSQAEASLRVQADQIAQRVKVADFNKQTERLAAAESSIQQTANRITTEIAQTEAKIPTQVGSRNYIKDSEYTTYLIRSDGSLEDLRFFIVDDFWENARRFKQRMVRVGFDIRFDPALPQDVSTNVHFSASPWYNAGGVTFKGGTTKLQHFDLLFDLSRAREDYRTDNVFIRLGDNLFPANTNVTVDRFTLYLSEMIELWIPAPEDITTEVKNVKTTIEQTADGVSQLTTKVSEAEGKLTNQETKINQLVVEVSSKVSQKDYDNLKNTVQTQASEIVQTKNNIALKVDKTVVDKLSDSISKTQVDLKLANDSIQAKVSKSDFDSVSRRVTNAETSITTLASQISTKLSRTDVNNIIDGKGFVTNSTLSNSIEQSEKGMISRITKVETMIPDSFGGSNLIMEGARQELGQYWENTTLLKHSFYHNSEKFLFQLNTNKTDSIWTSSNRFKVKRNTKYAFSFWTFSSGNMKNFDVYFLGRKKGETESWTSTNRFIKERGPSPHRAEYVTAIFDSGDNDEGFLRLFNNGSKDGKNAIFAFGEVMLVEGGVPAHYTPSPDELATTTALHEVKDTVDSHTRTIVEQGKSISQVIQTSDGIVSRVASVESNNSRLDNRLNFAENAVNAAVTQVSQLAGSWSVRNLNNAGDVLNQINLNRDGSVKIDGKLVQITGQTYIQDGVISSAKIKDLDAGKIRTGALDASLVNVININASNIVTGQINANLIRGGTLASQNGSIKWDLNGSILSFISNSRVEFKSYDNVISYTDNNTAALLKFNKTNYNAPEVTLGVNRAGEFNTSDGVFTGIRVRGFKYKNGTFVDEVYLIGDDIYFTGGYNENNGFRMKTAGENLGFYPSANRQYSLGSANMRFTTLFVDDVHIRASSTKSYWLRDVLGKLARACGVAL